MIVLFDRYKIVTKVTKLIGILLTCLLVLTVAGCAKKQISQPLPPDQEQVEPDSEQAPDPRTMASLQLTEQGRRLVEAGKSDQAIRVLEQAISLNPANGQNYYYLAEAWLIKKNLTEAREFNSLAELHLKDDTAWLERVARQADRIADLEK